ncbi:alpha-N-methyltransferase NTM1 [Gorgonomyces haynaldii]|nr:alpha-N-methyltransferase NTM1 [Gorgonomyces haynaldii]
MAFYQDAKQYWQKVDSTVDGMLGGYQQLSGPDALQNRAFLSGLNGKRALDCGAGIGRVTDTCLKHLFERVDLVEQEPKFLDQARILLGSDRFNYYPVGLQDFDPKEEYDLVWCQWVLSHLTDEDLVAFLKRCKRQLTPNGHIGIKENIARTQRVHDQEDSSFTRTLDEFKQCFEDAGLSVVKEELQEGFPEGLFPVRLFLLR